MAETISTNQFKNGMHVEVDGVIWRIVEFQHVKPGKGGAFVRTKLKAVATGKVVDKTFRAGESMMRVHTSVADMQFLYDDGTNVVLMNTETYEQIELPREGVAEEMQYVKENDVVQLLSLDGRPSSLQLPASVELAVTETEPGVKGDTVSNVTKPATLETGAVVQVPLFVNEGDKIKVDTREGRYLSRA
jgi:elongation factor P